MFFLPATLPLQIYAFCLNLQSGSVHFHHVFGCCESCAVSCHLSQNYFVAEMLLQAVFRCCRNAQRPCHFRQKQTPHKDIMPSRKETISMCLFAQTKMNSYLPSKDSIIDIMLRAGDVTTMGQSYFLLLS